MAEFEQLYVVWRKSTYSNSGGCVEVAAASGSVLIRDSANKDKAMLRLSPTAWSAFLVRARGMDPGPGPA